MPHAKEVAAFLLLLAPLGQSERRLEQIKELVEKSDVVIVALADSSHLVVNRIAYQRERERSPVLDPLRAERYTLGVLYRMALREVIYRDPREEERAAIGRPGDVVLIYVPGRMADPREFGKAAFMSGGEYLIFLKRAELKSDAFRHAVERVPGQPMSQWRPFPDPRLTYYTPVRDPFAVLLLDGAWQDFLLQTRAVVAGQRERPTR